MTPSLPLGLLEDLRRLPGVQSGPVAGGRGLVGVACFVHLALPLRRKLTCFAAQSQAQSPKEALIAAEPGPYIYSLTQAGTKRLTHSEVAR